MDSFDDRRIPLLRGEVFRLDLVEELPELLDLTLGELLHLVLLLVLVLASSTVKDLVAGSGLAFADAGEHDLKGVPDRWRLYSVVT